MLRGPDRLRPDPQAHPGRSHDQDHQIGDRQTRHHGKVLVLRFLEDKGYDEIAEIMRVPPGTVATLISRGTKQLRASLQAMGLNVRDTS